MPPSILLSSQLFSKNGVLRIRKYSVSKTGEARNAGPAGLARNRKRLRRGEGWMFLFAEARMRPDILVMDSSRHHERYSVPDQHPHWESGRHDRSGNPELHGSGD